jgi:hypothetical protein
MINIGLVIAPPWIDKILAGEKIWEVRDKPNARTGRIALCRKGGPIVATCTIHESIRLPAKDFARHFDKHRVIPEVLEAFFAGHAAYAWPLSDLRPIEPPIDYQHTGGGLWIRLSKDNVAEFDRLQRSAE